MSTCMISIIIPVYNIDQYIIECLESVRNQSYLNFEAIIVNDGSTDNCEELIVSYIAMHKLENFRYFSKENGGVSSARNLGLAHSRGEWIFYLDGDDWLEPDCLQILIDTLNQYPSDLVIGGYQAFDCQTGKTKLWSHYKTVYATNSDVLTDLKSFGFCWARLYKKSIIDQHNLRFDERIIYAEDTAWQFDYNGLIQSYACTNQVIYNYRINHNRSVLQQLITPRMKYYIWEHMCSFVASFEPGILNGAIQSNPDMTFVMWHMLTTAVINDILDKKFKTAKQKLQLDFAGKLMQSFVPKTKKQKLLCILLKLPFIFLCIFAMVYYNNFERLRGSRFVKKISAVEENP